jgi:mono/diheme cytochrome c family protein
VLLAEAMWNAGPVMQRAQLARGNAIPTFAGKEMADIQAYIRSRGLRLDRGVELLPLPDPSRGEALFRAKGCVACHGPTAGTEAPSLTAAALQLTVSEISGILWNHSYAMGDRMRARGIAFPVFAGGELADLISYLRFLGFFAEGGMPPSARPSFGSGAACSATPATMPGPRIWRPARSRRIPSACPQPCGTTRPRCTGC